jgi:hypothetical protein
MNTDCIGASARCQDLVKQQAWVRVLQGEEEREVWTNIVTIDGV